MAAPVSVLLYAHADTGAGRFLTALKAAGYAPRAVLTSTEEAFDEALPRERWDAVILVPGTMPITRGIASVRGAHRGVPVVVAEAPHGAESRLREAGADAVVHSGELERLGEAVSVVLAAAPPPPPGVAPGADPRALAVQDLAEHLPIGLYQTRTDGRIVYANEALPIVLGFDTRDDLADIDVRRDIGYPREHFEAQMARFGSVRNLVVRWTDRSGRTVYTREHARAVRDAEGNVSYFEGTMEDVTAEYAAREREVRRTEQFATIVRFATEVDDAEAVEDVYAAAVSAAEVVTGARLVLLAIDDGEAVRCVGASRAASKKGLAEAADRGLFAGVPIGAAPVVLDLQDGPTDEVNDELHAFLVSKGVASFAVYPLIYHGSARGAILACYDQPRTPAAEETQVVQTLAWHVAGAIARHHAEAGLRASEACLRFIDRHTDHVLFRLRYGAERGNSTFDYLSPAVEALVGYATKELDEIGGLSELVEEREIIEGDGLTDGPPPPDAFQGDGSPPRYVARYRMRTRSGESRWVENVAYVWTESDGRPVGLVGTLVDVTERKRREEAVAAEAARTLELQRTLVELGALGAVEPDAFIRRVTEAAAAAIGVDRALVRVSGPEGEGRCLDLFDAVAGEHVEESDMPADQFGAWLEEHGRTRSIALGDTLVDPRSLSTHADAYFRDRDIGALLSAAIRHQGQVAGVLSLHHLGGPRVWTGADLEFAAALADLLALALERAERLRAEEALREQELRYRAVSELTSDYAFAVRIHPDGRDEIDWATGAFARVTGYSADEVGAISGLLALFHPDCVGVVRNALALLEAGEAVDFEGRIRTKLGEERWVRHRARPGKPETDGTVVHYHGGEDVTDRKRFEQELIAAREQAEEMARLKSAFLANMSHEIRTPLTGILGYAGVLADEVTEPEHRESVEFIERSGHRLLETLDSVLELARLEANGVRPHAEVLDIAAEARLSTQLLAPVAEAKGIALAVVGDGPAHARLDRACLARILNNLIGNAVKFTDSGRVDLEIASDETHAHIRISDTGVGIDPHFLPRIFDEFRQESDGDARNHEGAGLGLAITRRLVDVLGGAVAVESEKGVGTTVTVTFPLHQSPIEEAAIDEQVVVNQPVDENAERVQPDFTPDETVEEREPLPVTALDSADDSVIMDNGPADGGSSLADDAESQLLDLIFPPDELAGEAGDEFRLDWADEAPAGDPRALEEGAGSWLEAADASLEALFAPASLHTPADSGDALGHTSESDAGLVVDMDNRPDSPLESDAGLSFDMSDGFNVGDGRDTGDGLDTEAWPDAPAEPDHEVRIAISPPLTANAMDATLTDGNGSARSHPPAQNDVHPVAQGPSVLVVEDNSDTRALLERILRPGYTTFAVGDARSALDLLHRERFDALVLDINLGGRETGVDVLRIARALPGNEALFAIALTAYALPGDRERFLEAGFDQYVSKPFTRTTLLTALREGLGEPKA